MDKVHPQLTVRQRRGPDESNRVSTSPAGSLSTGSRTSEGEPSSRTPPSYRGTKSIVPNSNDGDWISEGSLLGAIFESESSLNYSRSDCGRHCDAAAGVCSDGPDISQAYLFSSTTTMGAVVPLLEDHDHNESRSHHSRLTLENNCALIVNQGTRSNAVFSEGKKTRNASSPKTPNRYRERSGERNAHPPSHHARGGDQSYPSPSNGNRRRSVMLEIVTHGGKIDSTSSIRVNMAVSQRHRMQHSVRKSVEDSHHPQNYATVDNRQSIMTVTGGSSPSVDKSRISRPRRRSLSRPKSPMFVDTQSSSRNHCSKSPTGRYQQHQKERNQSSDQIDTSDLDEVHKVIKRNLSLPSTLLTTPPQPPSQPPYETPLLAEKLHISGPRRRTLPRTKSPLHVNTQSSSRNHSSQSPTGCCPKQQKEWSQSSNQIDVSDSDDLRKGIKRNMSLPPTLPTAPPQPPPPPLPYETPPLPTPRRHLPTLPTTPPQPPPPPPPYETPPLPTPRRHLPTLPTAPPQPPPPPPPYETPPLPTPRCHSPTLPAAPPQPPPPPYETPPPRRHMVCSPCSSHKLRSSRSPVQRSKNYVMEIKCSPSTSKRSISVPRSDAFVSRELNETPPQQGRKRCTNSAVVTPAGLKSMAKHNDVSDTKEALISAIEYHRIASVINQKRYDREIRSRRVYTPSPSRTPKGSSESIVADGSPSISKTSFDCIHRRDTSQRTDDGTMRSPRLRYKLKSSSSSTDSGSVSLSVVSSCGGGKDREMEKPTFVRRPHPEAVSPSSNGRSLRLTRGHGRRSRDDSADSRPAAAAAPPRRSESEPRVTTDRVRSRCHSFRVEGRSSSNDDDTETGETDIKDCSSLERRRSVDPTTSPRVVGRSRRHHHRDSSTKTLSIGNNNDSPKEGLASPKDTIGRTMNGSRSLSARALRRTRVLLHDGFDVSSRSPARRSPGRPLSVTGTTTLSCCGSSLPPPLIPALPVDAHYPKRRLSITTRSTRPADNTGGCTSNIGIAGCNNTTVSLDDVIVPRFMVNRSNKDIMSSSNSIR